MDIIEYWSDIEFRLGTLLNDGFVKLPSLKVCDLDKVSADIADEMGALTFKELGSSHKNFLGFLKINEYLTPRLYEIAKKVYNFDGEISNQYHIARKVEPGNVKEMYRAHFDSHIFTMVIPIKIPKSSEDGTAGDLIYFPNSRKMPNNEFTNVFDKVIHKKYASKKGLEKFAVKHKKNTENFIELEPLIFLGNTTLHTNHPVTEDCSDYRLTLLAHFFDNSPKISIGSLLRTLRNR
ncbi:hypothetical protein OAO56_02600 [Amylibacter sp.]|nr:hypothetical protein [Amylibacter sp.]